MTKREEFEKENNGKLDPITIDRIWNWHISEMEKMLEGILEENKDKDFGTYDYNGIVQSVIKLVNNFKKEIK